MQRMKWWVFILLVRAASCTVLRADWEVMWQSHTPTMHYNQSLVKCSELDQYIILKNYSGSQKLAYSIRHPSITAPIIAKRLRSDPGKKGTGIAAPWEQQMINVLREAHIMNALHKQYPSRSIVFYGVCFGRHPYNDHRVDLTRGTWVFYEHGESTRSKHRSYFDPPVLDTDLLSIVYRHTNSFMGGILLSDVATYNFAFFQHGLQYIDYDLMWYTAKDKKSPNANDIIIQNRTLALSINCNRIKRVARWDKSQMQQCLSMGLLR